MENENLINYIITTLRKYAGRSRLDYQIFIAEMRDYIDLNIIKKRNVNIILYPEEREIINALLDKMSPEQAILFLDELLRKIESGEVAI